MRTGIATYWQLTSLQAFWPGLQASQRCPVPNYIVQSSGNFHNPKCYLMWLGSCWGYCCCKFITSWILSCMGEVWVDTGKVLARSSNGSSNWEVLPSAPWIGGVHILLISSNQRSVILIFAVLFLMLREREREREVPNMLLACHGNQVGAYKDHGLWSYQIV